MDKIFQHKGLLLILSLFFLAGMIRMNDVSIYTPDSALYLIWGNSVAHGHGFVDNTKPEADRYILNAPFYAVLLAPIERLFPMSLGMAKFWTLLWGCAALVLFYVWLQRIVGQTAAVAGALLLAFNPMVLIFSTEVLSEAPFLVFLFGIFLIAERSIGEGKGGRGGWPYVWLFVLSGCVVILREVGIALVLAVVTAFLIGRKTRPALGAGFAALAVLVLWYVRNNIIVGVPPGGRPGNFALIFQHFLTGPNESIIRELVLRASANLRAYGTQGGGSLFYSMFSNAQFNLVVDPSRLFQYFAHLFEVSKYFIILAASILMVVGLLADVFSERAGAFRLLFILFLIGIIAIYPVYDIRFLTPVLPLMIYYLLYGIRWIVSGVFRKGWNEKVLVWLAILLVVPNAAAIADILRTNMRYRLDPESFSKTAESVPVVFTWPWSRMGEWIVSNTASDALIATPVKDIARAVGDRKVLELEPNIALPAFENVLRDYNVRYLLAAVRWGDLRTYEFLMEESKRYAFTHLYSAGTLHLYKVTSRLEQTVDQPDLFILHADTVSGSGLARTARMEIRSGDFSAALKHLAKARTVEPNMEEPVYQTIVASVLAGDSARARGAYRDLLAMPQTLSQSLMGARLIQALDLQMSAAVAPPDRAALQLLDASLVFWNNGYGTKARSVLEPVLVRRPDFFAGLQWGFHYNLQLGDTNRAAECLRQLRSIDTTNAVVRAFSSVIRELDSLRQASSAKEKAKLHTAMAVQYRSIELPDAALDEAERALRDDPEYSPAMTFIGGMLEAKSRYLTAAWWYRHAAQGQPRNAEAFDRAKMLDSLAANGITLAKPQ